MVVTNDRGTTTPPWGKRKAGDFSTFLDYAFSVSHAAEKGYTVEISETKKGWRQTSSLFSYMILVPSYLRYEVLYKETIMLGLLSDCLTVDYSLTVSHRWKWVGKTGKVGTSRILPAPIEHSLIPCSWL